MINKIYRITNRLTINKIVIFLFIVIYCGCYYQEYLHLITFSYLLLGSTFVYNWLRQRKINNIGFIILSLLFVLYSYFSALWSINYEISIDASQQLIKSCIISLALISLIDTIDNYNWALFSFAISGIIYSILYLLNVDIAHLGANRISTVDSDIILPNVNTVALLVSFSFVYFIYYAFYKKKSFFLIIAGLIFIITFILGARKSIFSLFICIIMIFFKLNTSSRIRIILLFFILIVLLSIFIPSDYLSFVSERLFQINFLSNKTDSVDESAEIRLQLIESGINYSMNKPVFGNGYYSFSQLLLKDKGIALYSHNNFLEVIVGGGIIGFLLYYNLYIIILNKCIRSHYKYDNNYFIIILMVIILFNHMSIVVIQERFIWVLLAILYAGAKLYKKNESRFFSK